MMASMIAMLIILKDVSRKLLFETKVVSYIICFGRNICLQGVIIAIAACEVSLFSQIGLTN